MAESQKKTLRVRKNVVGDRVRQARNTIVPPITQDQLAGRLAAIKVTIDRPGIAKLENGMRRVFDFEVLALAQALRVDLRWLLGVPNIAPHGRRTASAS